MTPQVTQDMDILHLLNETELAQLIRSQMGMVVVRAVGRDRMIEILEHCYQPGPHELSKTDDSRKRLQLYVEKNWTGIQSQLPCKGDNRGRCTIYPCPEGRHIDCLLAAGPHLKMHGL